MIHSHGKSLHNNGITASSKVQYTENPEQKLDVLLDVAGNVLLIQSYLADFEKMIRLSKEAKKIKKQYIKIMNYINAELHEDYRQYYTNKAKTIYAGYMRSAENGNFGGIHIFRRYMPQRKTIH